MRFCPWLDPDNIWTIGYQLLDVVTFESNHDVEIVHNLTLPVDRFDFQLINQGQRRSVLGSVLDHLNSVELITALSCIGLRLFIRVRFFLLARLIDTW